MAKQSKQIIIDAIVKEIENGVERGKCLAKIVKKWQISSRTFDRYWKTANQQQQERQRKASEAADAAYIAAKEQAAKEAVMSKQERLELLTKIAKGNYENEIKKPAWNHSTKQFQIVTVKEKPDHVGIIKAIAEMNKMEGDYAPAKTEVSGKDGKALFPTVIQVEIVEPNEED